MLPRLCIATFALAAPAMAQLQIVRVPEFVELPAPAGRNLLLEVRSNAVIDGNHLELTPSPFGVGPAMPLVWIGNNRFQCNLADPRVAALLAPDAGGGELVVVGKSLGKFVAHSAPIRWTRLAADDHATCLLRHTDGSTRSVAPEARTHVDAARLAAIEVRCVADTVVAHLGTTSVPMLRHDSEPLWSLADLAALRAHGAAEAVLELEAHRGAQLTVFRLRLAPTRLPDEPVAFEVPQRGSQPIPGTDRWLTVHLDDITMGQVRLTVTDASGAVAVPSRSVIEREAVPFTLGGQPCLLVVTALVNNLFGDDHAELTVRPAGDFTPNRVAQLIRAVQASEDMFVREGSDWSGTMAAQFLIARLGPAERAITVDEFVDGIGSRSSRTGEPYHVRRKDGTTVTMQAWLRAELARIEAAEPVRGR